MPEAKKSRFPLNFTILFTLGFLVLYWPGALMIPAEGVFKHFEDVWADRLFLMRHDSLKKGDERIVLAAIDADTGKKFGFPLPRIVHANLLDKLKAYGVKTVVFDMMFFEPREYDKEFAAATKRFGRVVHLANIEAKDLEQGTVVSVELPVPGLRDAAQYIGYPNIQDVIDSDGHLRRAKLFDHRTKDPKGKAEFAPSMDAAGVASWLDKPLDELIKEHADPYPKEYLINFRRPQEWLAHPKRDEGKQKGKAGGESVANLQTLESPYRTISVLDLLSGELTEEQRKALKGALLIVGSTTLGYFDHYPTPFTSTAPGPEYHANHMDNVINGDFLRSVPRGAAILVILAMLWLPLALLRLSPHAGNMVVGGVLVGWFGATYWQFGKGLLLPFVAPMAALVSSFLVLTVHRVLTEGAEKKFIKGLFGQFVAPQVVEELAQDPSKVKLGGEKRDMTIFFLDIAHFTTISEKMKPEALILFLNKYLSALSHIVHEQSGVVDKYIGDCIMAFWNAPIELKDHRVKACLAAIQCQAMMKELNKDLDPTLPEIPKVRIGLNSGTATVGLTGSEKKLQYTVIGDEVNLASRLEGANKFFGSGIMASEATYGGAKDVVEARELGRVRVVGKAIPIRVFELLAEKGKLSPEWAKALPRYNAGLAAFNAKQFDKAVAEFEEVVKVFPQDGPGNLYLSVARDYSAIPPPDDWDGVFNLTAK